MNEYEEWENSIEGIHYNINLEGDEYVDNNDYRLLITKTLQKIPKHVRKKIVANVIFIVDVNYGYALHIPKNTTQFIILNKLAMENESESFVINVIAHEIAHIHLGHHKKIIAHNKMVIPNQELYLKHEKEVDDQIVKWGFERTNESLYKNKI